ncbi:FGGY-family carbohydrate kinase [Comamonas composti]|uniref:FGGY-family carbohydrate kinase n=1 Tax=Comamonas composti TaxID=408558 RepID=UPI00047CC118|nr:hypothetical protein [Comamonas composti]
MSTIQPLIVFDFGKTNAKMFVFAPDLSILYQERCHPVWREQGPYRVLDSDALWEWMQAALRRSQAVAPADGIMISTHGCTVALLGDDDLAWPILDYESSPPEAIGQAFSAIVPPFEETLSPMLEASINCGKQIFWISETQPQALTATRAIVPYPQFWGWKLGAPALSEISSLGCHTHLWAPYAKRFSTLTQSRGWQHKMPPLAAAGAVVGKHVIDGQTLRLHNGVHDSNASLYLGQRITQPFDCTVVSTGTWIVAFNPSHSPVPFENRSDILSNIDIQGRIMSTARFMGGREYSLLTGGKHLEVSIQQIEDCIALPCFALPAFAPGGPFSAHKGRFAGRAPISDEDRAAVAALYLACMSSTLLDLLHSDNTVLIDGGLSNNTAYAGLLAALRPHQQVRLSSAREGTATGAALIAYEALGHRPAVPPGIPIQPMQVQGLADYYRRWQALCRTADG